MKNSLIYVLLVTCIFIAGTAQSAMTQANPSPSPSPTHHGQCRNEDNDCPCFAGRARNNKGQCVTDPCLKQREAHDDANKAEKTAQIKLQLVDRTRPKPADWEQQMKDATQARDDAIKKEEQTFKDLQKCLNENGMKPGG